MKIRQVRPGDASSVVELLGELGYPATVEQVVSRLEALSDGDVVPVAGHGVGLIALHRINRLAEGAPVARITALVVAGEYRRRGVAQAVVRAAERVARSWGCELLEVSSGLRPERSAAHRFYVDAGFFDTADRSTRYWRAL